MTPERWRVIRDLFDEAAELPPGERTKLVADCTDDGVRAEVLAMLGALNGSDPFEAAIAREASAVLEVPHEGKRIGAYKLIRELGAGGMGRVYLAERDDDQYRTQVAVKVLQRGFGTAAAVARFRDERQILATLEHPGIVRLLDGGTDDGLPYLVMERVEGVSITQYADDHALSTAARIELFLGVCEALQYAHQRMIVHRDLKPSNILVDAAGAPKLLDFGIAKLLDDHAVREAHTGTGLALFTPEYASPEQVRAQPVSAATDVYSMGAVLYHLLAGAPPHRITGDAVETLRVICDLDPPLPSTVASADRAKALTGDIDIITSKALAKEPAARYSSIEQFAEDLRRHLGGLPISARANTWSYRAGRFVRRNRTAVIVAAAIATALVGAAVVSIVQARAAREAAAIARARADQLVLNQADELRERDPTAALAWLKQYPTSASWERAREIVADASARGVALHVFAHPRPVSQIALAHDARRLVTRQGDGSLRLWDVAARSFVEMPVAHDIEHIAFSPDGTRLFASTTDRGMRVYDTTSWRVLATVSVGARVFDLSVARDNRVVLAIGDRIELWDGTSPTTRHIGDHKDLSTVAFSPDGRTIASSGLDKHLVFWDLADGASRSYETPAAISTLVYSPDGTLVAGTGWAIEVWNVETGARTSLDRPLLRLGNDVTFVDGNRVAFGDNSGTVHIWTPANGDVQTLLGHRIGVEVLAASEDGRTLATAADREVRVWTVPPRRRVAQLGGTATDIPEVSGDCRFAASGDSRGNVTVWNTVTDEVFTLSGHATWVNAIEIAPDNRHLVSTDYTTMRLWDLETKQGRVIRTSTTGRLKWSKFLSDGTLVVVDNDELVVLGNDYTTPTCRVPGGNYRASKDGRRLAVHRDGVVSIVELPSCQVREVAHKSEPTTVALSPDGTQLVMIGFESGQSEVLDLARGTTRPLEGGEVANGIDFSADGTLVVAAGRYGTIRVWETATGKLRRQFRGHKGSIGRAKFSPDTTMLASIDAVGALRTWSVTGDQREVHYGHTSHVMGVAFCSRGDFLVSSGFDGTLRMWSTAPALPRPVDPTGLHAWLGTVTTAQATADGSLASPPR